MRDESIMRGHEECCEYRPEGQRCGAETSTSVCTRPPGHGAQHYDAVRSVTFTEGAVNDWKAVVAWRNREALR